MFGAISQPGCLARTVSFSIRSRVSSRFLVAKATIPISPFRGWLVAIAFCSSASAAASWASSARSWASSSSLLSRTITSFTFIHCPSRAGVSTDPTAALGPDHLPDGRLGDRQASTCCGHGMTPITITIADATAR